MKQFVILAAAFLTSCAPAHLGMVRSQQAARPDDDVLTQATAVSRAQQVQSVAYNLKFHFGTSAESFVGTTTMKVSLRDSSLPLSIDAVTMELVTVRVNGREVKDYEKRNGSFDIPAKYLHSENSIEVVYNGKYSQGNDGLIRFEDPEDNAVYLYTNFEPYGAHKAFPCLDQPDLKASYRVSMSIPATWHAISNTPVTKSEELSEDYKLVEFAETMPISSYLAFIGAGEYSKWESTAGNIPLAIYARKSLAKNVDVENIFDITRRGLDWFQKYFDVAYPFAKYDHVFAPDLGPGAMENPGAVTMNEKMIFRSMPTPSKISDRANTILHEMAHMWFGDLVTMKWWNDLWLNESFASYASVLAEVGALGDKSAWESFFWDKGWGYWQDGLSTTHPIETDVSNTSVASSNFDGITYAKGASVLKQLHHFIGEDAFRNGVSSYFKTHAWKNTERKDFIAALEASSGIDLSHWTKSWLQSAGTHHVRSEWECNEDKVSRFVVYQARNASDILSPHRVRFAFFHKGDHKLQQGKVYDVTFSDEVNTIDSIVGQKCPDAVLPNYDDLDFANFEVDSKSLAVFSGSLSDLPQPLSRAIAWYTLGGMASKGTMKALDFVELVKRATPSEKEPSILGGVFGRYSFLSDVYSRVLTPQQRLESSLAFDTFLFELAADNNNSAGLRALYREALLRYVSSQEFVSILSAALHTNLLLSQPISQSERWEIIKILARAGHDGAPAVIENELQSDGSYYGRLSADSARAAIPTVENKETQWNTLLDFTQPASRTDAIASEFQNIDKPELAFAFMDRYFKTLVETDWTQHFETGFVFLEKLFPRQCELDLLTKSEEALAHHRDSLHVLLVRGWTEANDDLRRCVVARSLNR